eukprot:CAMPEP_0114998886 /NCGR_PEP_ID=MMETSP0216-20121206/15793_1 /TAXON_ID=223996 /ORGANISM="Protocruzia adherens, Strain Boccale" /LENGTH=115 /DNA_ID=CAMNT_0002363607 /DNA_START=112 /DNA_END=459 /DNA_ORIENTATION=+
MNFFLHCIITALILGVELIYPIFKTIDTVRSQKYEDQWMAYWVLFAAFRLFNPITALIPFFWIVRFLLFLWLVHPTFQGADYLFNEFIADLFVNVEEKYVSQIKAKVGGASAKKD